MNEFPTSDENPDEADERYRRLSDRSPSGPSDAVRRAVLRHAAELAAKQRRWRVATFGGLAAAAALTGLLLVPHFLMPTPVARRPAPLAAAGPGTSSPEPVLPSAARNADESGTAAAPRVENRVEPPATASDSRAVSSPAAAPPSRALSLPRAASLAAPATALHEAARSGDMPALQRLVAAKADIDARDVSGRTALMLAVRGGHKSAVDALLAAGADPNAADAAGTTPLEAARAGGHSAIATALEQAGAR